MDTEQFSVQRPGALWDWLVGVPDPETVSTRYLPQAFNVRVYGVVSRRPLSNKKDLETINYLFVPEVFHGSYMCGTVFKSGVISLEDLVGSHAIKGAMHEVSLLSSQRDSSSSSTADDKHPTDQPSPAEDPIKSHLARFVLNRKNGDEFYMFQHIQHLNLCLLNVLRYNDNGPYEMQRLVVETPLPGRLPHKVFLRIRGTGPCQFCQERGIECECPTHLRRRTFVSWLDANPYNGYDVSQKRASRPKRELLELMNPEGTRVLSVLPARHTHTHSFGLGSDAVNMRQVYAEFLHRMRTPVAMDLFLTVGSECSSSPPNSHLLECPPRDSNRRDARASTSASSKHKDGHFTCDVCGTSFSKAMNLNRHRESVHDKIRPFKCPHCDLSFHQKIHMSRHVKSVHEKSKPFHCNVCDARFSLRNNLVRHERVVHKRLKPYCCNLCDPPQRFGDRSDIRKHMKRRHPGEEISNFQVDDDEHLVV